MNKVHNGTPQLNTTSLCLTCRQATIIRGVKDDPVVSCGYISSALDRRLESIQPVVRCTQYDDKRMPSLSHLKEIAWCILPDKKTGKMGFVQPKSPTTIINNVNGEEIW